MKAVTLRTIYTRTRLVDRRGYIIFVGSLIVGKGDHTIVNSNDPAPAAPKLTPCLRYVTRLADWMVHGYKKTAEGFFKTCWRSIVWPRCSTAPLTE